MAIGWEWAEKEESRGLVKKMKEAVSKIVGEVKEWQ